MKKIPKNKKVTLEQEKEIVNRYLHGETTVSLYKDYGYSTPVPIGRILRKNGISPTEIYLKRENDKKTYSNFSMDSIDTAFKAYFLGLLLTDGYISPQRNMVGIDLTDEDVIQYLAEGINAKYLKLSPYKNEKVNEKVRYRLDLRSKALIEELSKYGVVPNKSKTLNPPEELLFNKYLADILRGVIDGDGWVRKDGKEFFICSASKAFIDWCNIALKSFGMKDLNVTYNPNGAYVLRSGRQENIKILKTAIYKEPYGMARKFNLLNLEGCSETTMETA